MPAALSPALSPTCLLRGLRSGVSLASWEAGRAPGCQGASRGRSGGWCRRTAGADGGRGGRSVFSSPGNFPLPGASEWSVLSRVCISYLPNLASALDLGLLGAGLRFPRSSGALSQGAAPGPEGRKVVFGRQRLS